MKLKNSIIFAFIFLSLFCTHHVSADGGIFIVLDYDEHVYLPSQKAAVLWDGKNETMIISTKIVTDNLTDVAWVIPIYSNTAPNVTKGDTEIFNKIAEAFGKIEYTGGWSSYRSEICLLSLFLLILGLLLLIISFIKRSHEMVLFIQLISLICIVVSLFLIFYGFSFFVQLSDSGYSDIEIIEMKKVDIYDIAILKSKNATELVDWLNINGFVTSESSIPVLQGYCNKSDIYFVVNKINISNMYTKEEEIKQAIKELQTGIATPLKITFEPETPFYPLRMTSINKGLTKINVYFISDFYVNDSSNILFVEDNDYISLDEYDGNNITWLSFEGNTKELTGDSYFTKIDI